MTSQRSQGRAIGEGAQCLRELTPVIATFFEQVLVMVDDDSLLESPPRCWHASRPRAREAVVGRTPGRLTRARPPFCATVSALVVRSRVHPCPRAARVARRGWRAKPSHGTGRAALTVSAQMSKPWHGPSRLSTVGTGVRSSRAAGIRAHG
jgi:hypothetical protein